MRVIALQDYTDQYISLFEGEIRDIEDLLANILLEKGVVGLNFPDDVSISQTTTTGTEIANISINGNSTTLYAPTGEGGNMPELFQIYNVVNNAQFNQVTQLEDGYVYTGEFNLSEEFDPTLPYTMVFDFIDIQNQQTEIKYAPGPIIPINYGQGSFESIAIESELLSNTFHFSVNADIKTIGLYYEAKQGQPYPNNIHFSFNIYQMTEHGIAIALAGVGTRSSMSLWNKDFVPYKIEEQH